MEAEYMSLSDASREALALNQLLQYLRLQINPPRPLTDNQGALAIVESAVHHHRAKRFDIRYHFIHHYVKTRDIEVNLYTHNSSDG